jgi:outer membrane protein
MFSKFKIICAAALIALGFAGPLRAAEPRPGVVDFRACMEDSKYGRQEISSIEAMQNQMVNQMEAMQKELQEIANKLQDPEFRDSISPETEEQYNLKGQQLAQELSRSQQIFQRMLQEAQMKMVQVMSMHIMRASQIVAASKKLDMVVNQEAIFYFPSTADVTTDVVAEMNKLYDQEVDDDGLATTMGGRKAA